MIYLYGVVFKVDYMFRLYSLGHHQVVSLYRANCTICKIKSLLFNEISFFVYKIIL
jgi:hypothetical protein